MDLTFIIAALAFAIGFYVIPPATRNFLAFKYQEIEDAWNESLQAYEKHVLFTKRKPSLSAERVERSMAQWAQHQIQLFNAGKLTYEQVLALRAVNAIPNPQEGVDPALKLPRDSDMRAKYQLECTLAMRLACGLFLAVVAAVLIYSDVGIPGTVSGLVAGVLMISTLICDMQARIIPYQFCIVFGIAAAIFALSVSGPQGLIGSLIAAGAMYAALYLVNRLMSYLSGSPAIGNGDLRFIPMICLFSGLAGTLYGFFGASVVMALVAIWAVLFKGGNRKSYVPYAPGLTCWYAIGLLAQASCA